MDADHFVGISAAGENTDEYEVCATILGADSDTICSVSDAAGTAADTGGERVCVPIDTLDSLQLAWQHSDTSNGNCSWKFEVVDDRDGPADELTLHLVPPPDQCAPAEQLERCFEF
ncbi:MAG: hypothetical protein IPK74_07630 [Deltaproteobacteria bacterium]|nr:hypothetical protein [Deltaproteobacteria bacterium]